MIMIFLKAEIKEEIKIEISVEEIETGITVVETETGTGTETEIIVVETETGIETETETEKEIHGEEIETKIGNLIKAVIEGRKKYLLIIEEAREVIRNSTKGM